MEFRHSGLQRFWENEDASRLNPNHLGRISRILTALSEARSPAGMELPGYRLHQMTGNRRGAYSVRVTANWRITFRFADGEAVEINLEDYH